MCYTLNLGRIQIRMCRQQNIWFFLFVAWDVWQSRFLVKPFGIERLVRNTNLAVVMPSTDLAWYTNTTYGARYYDAIVDGARILPSFPTNLSTKREKNFIAGLSMGGYGALK